MTKKRVKEAALTLFAEKGYDGTVLSEIAKAVGIKTPSLYAHFPSKEALFLEIYQDSIQMELTELGRAAEREDLIGKEKLQAIFFVATDFSSNPDEKKFFQRAVFYPPKSLFQELKEETKTYEQLTNGILRETLGEMVSEEVQLRWMHVFYALLDGLSVEHGIYDGTEFELRRKSAWEVLASLFE
ncbi:TetR/AcrR family transcriptional regulator [Listeria swaminathanii]|uniref:TetR/AcrR family transcriptional regulator n=1 Tax=Listeria swaminathanii TaxID=2713501 RepID=A0ABU2ID16_9LIST|nr:TetR/AcrR family transcriptional regulator [Listeria swaminathanii]MDT0016137.1 TetR/AcrR family transcriptional regulator [Listeria swaminathanii]MDT0021573.1 TetR/AcrR family transcriptional regulator [Listeria swaminathanii]MDT0032537.1 TetR/AcrR family transcriptional regulator [Listeria swaminathanii]MDT0051613.1 TetR/AcrR family transcriptional regulator [Listeria swaminathanii]MDT0054378.1 TetR/AcrR family transcriptional regulator [Listeria swaminathanii]